VCFVNELELYLSLKMCICAYSRAGTVILEAHWLCFDVHGKFCENFAFCVLNSYFALYWILVELRINFTCIFKALQISLLAARLGQFCENFENTSEFYSASCDYIYYLFTYLSLGISIQPSRKVQVHTSTSCDFDSDCQVTQGSVPRNWKVSSQSFQHSTEGK